MNRPLRIIRHRWLTIVVIVAITVVVALWTADLRNDSIKPRFRASAPVTFVDSVEEFESLGGSLLESVELQLEEARLAAIEINDDLLDLPGAEIQADPTAGRLTFIATGETADEAEARATEMRDRLLSLRPFNIDAELNEQIETTRQNLDEIREQIRALTAVTQADPEIEAERARLQQLLADFQDRALQLELWRRVPPTGEDAMTPDQVRAELDRVNKAIADVEAELAQLPETIDPLSPEATELRALQRQYDEMEVRYQNLLIQRTDLKHLPELGVVETLDETPTALPIEIAAGVAVVLGLGLAFATLLAIERLVAPVWFPGDVPQISFLPTVPIRVASGTSWYMRSGQSRRKSAIQAIRSMLRARVTDDEFVVAVTGSGIPSPDVQALGMDLAAAFASTSVSTVVIDATFESTWELPDFKLAAFSLADVVHAESDDQVHARVDASASPETDDQPHLTIVSTGSDIDAPADAVAGPRVAYLFDLLRETSDVVVVVCDDIDMPSTQALLDRSDVVLVATEPGKSRRAALAHLAEELTYRQIDVVGTFIKVPFFAFRRPGFGLRDRWRRWRGMVTTPVAPPLPESRSDAEVEPRYPRSVPVEEPSSTFEATPAVTAMAVETSSDGHDEVARFAASIVDDAPESEGQPDERPKLAAVSNDPGPRVAESAPRRVDEMFDLLRTSDPDEVAGVAQRFFVDSITALVLADENSRLDPTSVAEVREAGFVPFTTWKGHPSVGSRLRREFVTVLGKKAATDFERLLLKALASGHESADASSMDRWVSRHYFELHIEDTNGEPRVWHITSPNGTISALVAAERFERSRMEGFVDAVIIRAIERLARRRRRKELVGDQVAVDELDALIEDARQLGLAIARLLEGSRAESRLWYPTLEPGQQPEGWDPDWSQGIKHNLAPVQRLGLLAVPVLSERELKALEPSA